MAIKSKETPKTPLQEKYWKFWSEFNNYTSESSEFKKEFKIHSLPSVRSYQDYHIGEPFHIVAGINFTKKEIRIGAYFSDLISYHFWYNHGKRWVESYVNKQLKWKSFKTKGSVYTYLSSDFDEATNWEKTFSIMIENMIKMKNAFTEDVKL